MTSISRSIASLLRELWRGSFSQRAERILVATVAVTACTMVGLMSVGAASPLAMPGEPEPRADEGQTLVVSELAIAPPITRDSFDVTPGSETFIAGGTNHDWAKLVLLYGGWPVSDNNVTVIARWMRQENYIDSWWNRNNPLNNGWGSGGGGGLGSYVSLREAARNAAEALNTLPGYAPIRQSFAASAATEVTEGAIWASPWASGHYGNGAHWHYSPVPVVKAPASAW